MEVDLGLPMNVILGSVYLEHTVGLEGNMALLEAIAIEVRRQRKPWLIGGDLNMVPCYLHLAGVAGFPQLIARMQPSYMVRSEEAFEDIPFAFQNLALAQHPRRGRQAVVGDDAVLTGGSLRMGHR